MDKKPKTHNAKNPHARMCNSRQQTHTDWLTPDWLLDAVFNPRAPKKSARCNAANDVGPLFSRGGIFWLNPPY